MSCIDCICPICEQRKSDYPELYENKTVEQMHELHKDVTDARTQWLHEGRPDTFEKWFFQR